MHFNMNKKYKDYKIQQYLEVLSKKTPVPGGGSAAALTGALGVALLLMVAHYSLGKGKQKRVEEKISRLIIELEELKNHFIELIDLDAKAYQGIVNAKKEGPKAKKAAVNFAIKISKDMCKYCYTAIKIAVYLERQGNKYLLSDVEVAAENLRAAFNSAKINEEVNKKG